MLLRYKLFFVLALFSTFLFVSSEIVFAANPYVENITFSQDERGDYIEFDWLGTPVSGVCAYDNVVIWFNRYNPDSTTEGTRFPSFYGGHIGDFIRAGASSYSAFGGSSFASGVSKAGCSA